MIPKGMNFRFQSVLLRTRAHTHIIVPRRQLWIQVAFNWRAICPKQERERDNESNARWTFFSIHLFYGFQNWANWDFDWLVTGEICRWILTVRFVSLALIDWKWDALHWSMLDWKSAALFHENKRIEICLDLASNSNSRTAHQIHSSIDGCAYQMALSHVWARQANQTTKLTFQALLQLDTNQQTSRTASVESFLRFVVTGYGRCVSL